MSSSQAHVLIKQMKKSCPIPATTLLLRRFSTIREPRGFNNNDDYNDTRERESERESHYRNPPDLIPNRPLRGERPSNPQSTFLSSSQSPPLDFLNKKRDDYAPPQSDHDFLEKFKLGLDNRETNTTTELPQHQSNNNNNNKKKTTSFESPEDADEIFNKMKETGLIPNAVAMLDGLCKDGLVHEAMKLFGLMREKGTIPQVVIYTAVVDGYCKAHKIDDAKRIFKKMHTNGITPNAFSYGVLIQGLYKCNNLDDAVEFSVEMLEAGHSPNVTTFVGLVDGLCREKGVEEAQSVITTLRQKGFFVNEKAVKEFLDKKAPFSPSVWEVVFGKKTSQRSF